MPDVRKQFAAATRRVQQLAERPSDAQLLALYALYKQATAGDVTGARPGLLEPRARAKFDAWAAVRGLGASEAMGRYVRLVAKLAGA